MTAGNGETYKHVCRVLCFQINKTT